MILKHIEQLQNFSDITKEIEFLINEIGFKNNQISFQNLYEEQDDWYNSNGGLRNLAEQDEKKYHVLNSKLKNSAIDSLVQRFRGFRTRLMLMPPRKCYSVHSDPFKRIHIPIITNDQCWMVWPLEKQCFRLLEGRIYLADTTKQHSFFNGHESLDRIHIVMSVDETQFTL
jgi:hypothetical protein